MTYDEPDVESFAGRRVVVGGIGVSGFAAADALVERGAHVVVVDERDQQPQRERGIVLETLGAQIVLGEGSTSTLPDVDGAPPDLVITSPGWRPDQPLLAGAAAAGVPVWGEVELAWRLRPANGPGGRPAPWLTLTGTNGKTTTVTMLQSMLQAAGLRAVAAGNVGTPLLEAVLHPHPYDVIAVELSSFQLHWSSSLRPQAAACLNVADDHLDWHGGAAAYAAAKGKVYTNAEVACVYNVLDPVTEQLVRDAEVIEGCRAIGFTAGVPALSMLGVVEDVLCDRAFVEERRTSAAELGTLDDVREAGGGTLAPHNVLNALAAAALARAHGVPPVAVRDGLRGYRPEPHRIATVGLIRGVTYVDDSKATNTHAASASLGAYDRVVWIAGGLAKGARFDDLVARHRDRMRAVVLIGADRALIAEALARHAPDVPVVEVDLPQTGEPGDRDGQQSGVPVMDVVVARAAQLAQPGDTVLLAPACASMDMFDSYAARGDAFAEAVRSRAGSGGLTSATSDKVTKPAGPPTIAGRPLPAWLDTPLTSYYLVLGASVVLIGIGLVMVLSSSSVESIADGRSAFTVFWRQAIFACLGAPLMVIAIRMPPKAWARLSWPLLVSSVLLQLMVFSPLGVKVNGNLNWVSLAGFQLQPSEAGKLALTVWIAAVLARKRPLLSQPVHALVPVVPGAAFFLLLVLLGHDLGTALVIIAIVAGTLFVAGAPKRLFGLGVVLVGFVVLMLVQTSSNRMSRIASWRSDCTGDAALNQCFQSLHGHYALATGGWWGVGLGASREKWGLLPEAHNDFIFAIIGEELGLVGTLAVLCLFAALALGMIRIVLRHDDLFVKIATAGVLTWVVGQAVINIGVVIGLLPVIGLPLPLVSSGGSALVMTMAALGMVIGFARHEPGAQQALAARAGLVRRSLAVMGRSPLRGSSRATGGPGGRSRR